MARHPDYPDCWKCSVCSRITPRGKGYCDEHYAIEKKRRDKVEAELKQLAIDNAEYDRNCFIDMATDEKLMFLYDHIFGD